MVVNFKNLHNSNFHLEVLIFIGNTYFLLKWNTHFFIFEKIFLKYLSLIIIVYQPVIPSINNDVSWKKNVADPAYK